MTEAQTDANRQAIENIIRDAILWAPEGKVWQEATTEEREAAERAAYTSLAWLSSYGVLPLEARPEQTTAGVEAAKAAGVGVPRHVVKAIYEAMAKQFWGEP